MNSKDFIEKFCFKHGISEEEAMEHLIVKECIKDARERGKLDEMSVLREQRNASC